MGLYRYLSDADWGFVLLCSDVNVQVSKLTQMVREGMDIFKNKCWLSALVLRRIERVIKEEDLRTQKV